MLSRNVTRAPARRADSLPPAGPHPHGPGLNDLARAVTAGQTTGPGPRGPPLPSRFHDRTRPRSDRRCRTAGAHRGITQPIERSYPSSGKDRAMIKFLRSLGITRDAAYLAGTLSIGASIAAWTLSSRMENAPGEKADRWGIYVGLWAPTFMALGNAIQTAEGRD